MNQSIEYTITNSTAESVSVLLTGFINESTRGVLFALKGDLPKGAAVIFDTSGVTQINSVGMMHFSSFIGELDHHKVEYVGCSSVFMDFVAMIPAVFKEATIHSFYGEYYCKFCDVERHVLVASEDAINTASVTCDECGASAPAVGYLEDLLNNS